MEQSGNCIFPMEDALEMRVMWKEYQRYFPQYIQTFRKWF